MMIAMRRKIGEMGEYDAFLINYRTLSIAVEIFKVSFVFSGGGILFTIVLKFLLEKLFTFSQPQQYTSR